MKKFFIAAAAIAAASSVPAFAETFSGPYVGAEVGYDNYELKGDSGLGFEIDGISGNGAVGGIYVGYDYALSGNIFFGVEAFGNLSGAKVTLTDGVDTLKIKARESYGLAGRLGTMLNDSTAIYARGGVINTRFKATDGVDSESDTQTGFQYGGGIETRVGGQATIRVEYVANDYGNAGFDDVKVGNSQVRAGVSFRF